MKKNAVLLFCVFLSLPLGAGRLQCSVCGHTICSGKYFRSAEGQAICSRKCLLKLLPRCSVCGKILEGQYLQDNRGRIFCTEQCREKLLPKCSACGRPAASGARMSDGTILCRPCLSLPRCASCRELICSGAVPLEDGRKICAECRRTGIFSQERAQEEFDCVRRQLQEEFGLHAPGRILFHLVDKKRLQEFNGGGDADEFGICNHRVTAITEKGREIRREYRREICILHGLPPELFRATAAHELAHDWFNMVVGGKLSTFVMEGWAESVSWHYCRNRHYRKAQHQIETNGIAAYREGFKKMKAQLPLPADPARIREFFMAMHPRPLL